MRRQRGFGQYSPPDYFDAGWANVFVTGCEAIGANPLDVAGLLINESGFNPGARNSIGCVGLNQLCNSSYGFFSNDYTVDQYLALPVSEQLYYVFEYFQSWLTKYGLGSISAGELYQLNFLPATFTTGETSSYVIATKGDGYYDANSSLDVDGSGAITLGDLEQVIQNAKANNPDLYGYLEEQICLAGGCFGDTQTLVLAGFAAGFASFFAWNWWKTGRLV
jgi:hypothetical protein